MSEMRRVRDATATNISSLPRDAKLLFLPCPSANQIRRQVGRRQYHIITTCTESAGHALSIDAAERAGVWKPSNGAVPQTKSLLSPTS